MSNPKPILSYIVKAATKLFTSRKIGGVDFDGTQDINLPGVNTKGNQNTTGNAATATKLKDPFKLSITGDGEAQSVNIDGSENRSLSFTLKGILTGTTVGSKTKIPVLDINDKGLVTGISSVSIDKTVKTILTETRNIDTQEDITYDVEDILGSDISNYDLTTVTVKGMVKNEDPSSPANNMYINSESALVVAVSNDFKTVVIVNAREFSVEAKISITVMTN